VYSVMNGPDEFMVTGTLKDWDVMDCLGEINEDSDLEAATADDIFDLLDKEIRDS